MVSAHSFEARMNKRYEQPYRSQHVLHNTKDSLRTEEPGYVRDFPQSLHLLYKKQIPYNPRRTGQPKSPARIPKPIRTTMAKTTRGPKTPSYNAQPSATRKSLENTKSPSENTNTNTNTNTTTNTTKDSQYTQPLNFKTVGAATKSPSAPLSVSMPSDFEHIFHYSET